MRRLLAGLAALILVALGTVAATARTTGTVYHLYWWHCSGYSQDAYAVGAAGWQKWGALNYYAAAHTGVPNPIDQWEIVRTSDGAVLSRSLHWGVC